MLRALPGIEDELKVPRMLGTRFHEAYLDEPDLLQGWRKQSRVSAKIAGQRSETPLGKPVGAKHFPPTDCQ
jgi:hypothetical protein